MNRYTHWVYSNHNRFFTLPVVDRKLLGFVTAWESNRIIPTGYPAASTRRTVSRCSSRHLANRRVPEYYSRRRCHPPGHKHPYSIFSSYHVSFQISEVTVNSRIYNLFSLTSFVASTFKVDPSRSPPDIFFFLIRKSAAVTAYRERVQELCSILNSQQWQWRRMIYAGRSVILAYAIIANLTFVS